jgi:hypothetical protein
MYNDLNGLIGFNFNVIKNMAQGLVSRRQYSNQFDFSDPHLLILALFSFVSPMVSSSGLK